jgi:hypothetical protein
MTRYDNVVRQSLWSIVVWRQLCGAIVGRGRVARRGVRSCAPHRVCRAAAYRWTPRHPHSARSKRSSRGAVQVVPSLGVCRAATYITCVRRAAPYIFGVRRAAPHTFWAARRGLLSSRPYVRPRAPQGSASCRLYIEGANILAQRATGAPGRWRCSPLTLRYSGSTG